MGIKNIKKFFKDLGNALSKKINKLFIKDNTKFIIAVQNAVTDALLASETYKSLGSGNLRGHFGFPKGTSYERADYVINTLVDNIGYRLKKFKFNNGVPSGELIISFVPGILSILYNNELAIVRTKKGYQLPWLFWLLEAGSTPVIYGYRISFLDTTSSEKKAKAIMRLSRSGIALMFKNGNGIWYVPAKHQGTIDDNWITRAIEANSLNIKNRVKKAIK